MEKTICKRARTVHFWDGYAKWYKQWIEHGDYHGMIIKILMTMVKPGWKILDIGSGNGILALPLCAIGCDVTALEPSIGMRSLLYEEAGKRGIDWIKTDEKSWEEVSLLDYKDYDLIIASNTLHLTQMGFEKAISKMFRLRPANVFVVTEIGLPEIKLKWQYDDYSMLFAKSYETECSFAYHNIDEVIDHWEFKKNRRLHPTEKFEIQSKLTYKDEHLWMNDKAYMGMYWWKSLDKNERP